MNKHIEHNQKAILGRHPDARVLWAIQMATINTFKYRGFDRLADFFGRHSIEHSYTRLVQIWVDSNEEPLINPDTQHHYRAINVQAALNPGAIDPENGFWTPMNISSAFNRIRPKSNDKSNQRFKLGVFSLYGEDFGEEGIFNSAVTVEDPVTVRLGDHHSMERLWLNRQKLALEINAQELDYDLTICNCHTMTVTLNGDNIEAVEKFRNNGFFRWGANPEMIQTSEFDLGASLSLEELQKLNSKYPFIIDEERDLRVNAYRERHGLIPENKPNDPEFI